MYQKLSNQAESLKGLWAAKLNLSGRPGRATREDISAYDAKLSDLEAELERRKELGRHFGAVTTHMKQLSEADELAREEHQVGF